MALFFIAEQSSDFLAFSHSDEVQKLKSDDAYLILIDLMNSATKSQEVDVPGFSVIIARDTVDAVFLMKKTMDGKNILGAKCILPKENHSEFVTMKNLLFPSCCEVIVDSLSEIKCMKSWKTCHEYSNPVGIVQKYLSAVETGEGIQTVQSKMIPSDVFIHGYSKRYGGVSSYPGMNSLNLVYSLRKPDSIYVVKENAHRLCSYLNVNADGYHLAKANHGNRIWVFEEDASDNYDGIITNTQGITVACPGADCNLLLLADPVTKSCGAVHAGWKGILAGVVESAINSMKNSYGCDPKNIIAALGPSLSVCCCEFGIEDSKKFLAIGENVVVQIEGKDKPHLDLRLAARLLLEKCGVQLENIDDGLHGANPTTEIAVCTKCDKNKEFFSFRRDGPKFGNQVAFISIR